MGIVRERRKAETRTRLIEAGLPLFAERGFDLVTLDEVAEAAGFTKGAIYRQFPSKGAFQLALFEQYAADPHRYGAVLLAGDNQGIDHGPAILDYKIALQ